MRWSMYRAWKHAVVPAIVLAGSFVMRSFPEDSPAWTIGVIVAVVLGLAYVAEEIVWIGRGKGRPCAHCGKDVRLKSFSVRNTCPHCGNQL